MKNLILLIALSFTSFSAFSDYYAPSHSCSTPNGKPTKPYQFNSQYEVDNYNSEVESYYNDVETFKQCINDFIEKQREEANNHNTAASNAIDDWNSFVNYGY